MKDLDGGDGAEVRVLGHDGYPVLQRSRSDPGVVAAQAATGAELLVGDAREARGGRVVDGEQRVACADPHQSCQAPRSRGRTFGAQDPELEFGGRDDGDRELVGQIPERPTSFTGDED